MSEKRNRSSLTLEVPYRRKREAADDKHSATHNKLILEIRNKNVEERSFSNFKSQRDIKDKLKEIRMDIKAIKNREYMMNKGRLEFEKVLDRN